MITTTKLFNIPTIIIDRLCKGKEKHFGAVVKKRRAGEGLFARLGKIDQDSRQKSSSLQEISVN